MPEKFGYNSLWDNGCNDPINLATCYQSWIFTTTFLNIPSGIFLIVFLQSHFDHCKVIVINLERQPSSHNTICFKEEFSILQSDLHNINLIKPNPALHFWKGMSVSIDWKSVVVIRHYGLLAGQSLWSKLQPPRNSKHLRPKRGLHSSGTILEILHTVAADFHKGIKRGSLYYIAW